MVGFELATIKPLDHAGPLQFKTTDVNDKQIKKFLVCAKKCTIKLFNAVIKLSERKNEGRKERNRKTIKK